MPHKLQQDNNLPHKQISDDQAPDKQASDKQAPLKFVIAPDSFKESLTAEQAANAIAQGIKQVFADTECLCMPMADGGEGTAAALCAASKGDWCSVEVQNPLGELITANYALLPNQCAVIEMAQAAGLALLKPEQRNPLLTSTYGVGQMIMDALSKGVRKFIIGIGGSATNDGGSGMLSALGVQFFDIDKQPLALGAKSLASLANVDLTGLDSRLAEANITIACDVNNPLLGVCGASAVFAEQKGADKAMIAQLDDALSHYAAKMIDAGFADNRTAAGSGAAGGLGFALLGLTNSSMHSGIDLLIRESGFNQALQDADFVITGEGRMDNQTLLGKVPIGVLNHVNQYTKSQVTNIDTTYVTDFEKKDATTYITSDKGGHHKRLQQGIPVIALCGCLGESHEMLDNAGFSAILPIIPYIADEKTTLANAAENLQRTARNMAALIAIRR